jgi:hypothetical protein
VPHRKAIAKIRTGHLNKVVMWFPRAAGDTGVDFLALHSDPAPLCYSMLNLAHYCGAPALVGFTSGLGARAVEDMSDDEVVGRVIAHPAFRRWADDPDGRFVVVH